MGEIEGTNYKFKFKEIENMPKRKNYLRRIM